MNRFKNVCVAILMVVIATVGGCSTADKDVPRDAPELLLEKILSEHRENEEGGFSHSFVAYIRQTDDESEYYVDVNGEPVGPFDRISRKFFFNADGTHMAFAAESEGSWWVVVDGEKRWQHDGLGFFWQGWTANLEGTLVIPQTQAVVFALDDDSDQISYLVSEDGKWAVATNGTVGDFFDSVSRPRYVAGQLRHTATNEAEGEFVITGGQRLGPFAATSVHRFSDDGLHVGFTAERAGTQVLFIDGEEQTKVNGISDFVLGPDGTAAFVVKEDGGSFVQLSSGDTRIGPYDAIAKIHFNKLGNRVAFYARKGREWKVTTSDGVEYPAGEGYYIIRSGDRDYSLMWSIDSKHLVYFIKKQSGRGLMLDGGEIEEPSIGGFAMEVLFDDGGREVGVGLMNGPYIDRYAFASAVASGNANCDPASARTVAGSVSCLQDNAETGQSLLIGDQLQGPYDEIRSAVMSNQGDSHYAYTVLNGDTEAIVLDGKVMTERYEKIYRPQFVKSNEVAFLGLRDGSLYHVRYGL